MKRWLFSIENSEKLENNLRFIGRTTQNYPWVVFLSPKEQAIYTRFFNGSVIFHL